MTPMTDVVTAGAARYAGHRINRVEDTRLLTGTGVYVDDIALPGMLHDPVARGLPAAGGRYDASCRPLPGRR
jgi:aerobic carbon-monoxide dehydrogenase large subunit